MGFLSKRIEALEGTLRGQGFKFRSWLILEERGGRIYRSDWSRVGSADSSLPLGEEIHGEAGMVELEKEHHLVIIHQPGDKADFSRFDPVHRERIEKVWPTLMRALKTDQSDQTDRAEE